MQILSVFVRLPYCWGQDISAWQNSIKMMSWGQAKHTNNELSSQHCKIHQQTHCHGKTTSDNCNYAIVSKMITAFPLWLNQGGFILITGIHCLFNHLWFVYFQFLIKSRSSRGKNKASLQKQHREAESTEQNTVKYCKVFEKPYK